MDPQGIHASRRFTLRLSLWLIISFMLATPSLAQVGNNRPALSDIIEAYFQQAAEAFKNTKYEKSAPQKLHKQVARLKASGDNSLAAAIIIANKDGILNDIDSDYTAYFIRILLEYELLKTANQLAEYSFNNASSYTLSRVHYELALYHFEQDDIETAFKHLTAIDSSDALTKPQQDYATLMFGVALQKKKKHRQALKIYERIEKESEYYQHAQLNIAIANIRQGWWTDAQLSIERALAGSNKQDLNETNNRLLLVLAYSQLQNEFYRNARNTLRKIDLRSIYVNKALLGLGLSALNQKDFTGALNAFSRLQENDDSELSVIESYLLIPYTYERMGDLDQASALYTEAIAYFEVKKKTLSRYALSLTEDTSAIQQNTWYGRLPKHMIKVHTLINELAQQPSSENAKAEILKQKSLVESDIARLLGEIIRQDISSIDSYISQSQYGLAKLYDSQ